MKIKELFFSSQQPIVKHKIDGTNAVLNSNCVLDLPFLKLDYVLIIGITRIILYHGLVIK